jgi:hypothetical protein
MWIYCPYFRNCLSQWYCLIERLCGQAVLQVCAA